MGVWPRVFGVTGMRAPPACSYIGCGLGPLCRLVGQCLAHRVCDERLDSLPAATGFSVDC